ncbi:sulfate reduction electron transfer complex DsrMKJOP subunit DsrO [Thermodesulforhabdus norvegica]|uniref:Putative sulfite reductase-associated electron transfer protein DsrO n=1 Tax=Thermodesulforhabdus norvegica TaxID=39841 RepID=A0A1I4TD72_9BACT|nr:4Fe-4S dicluster domain-containing protein [Thermodesulforhabdus norvegica]SFM74520.1 putative sulfite reductase-associated electron transfer protein DsrO [Thermodesulforhabdus norvegica]
MNKDRRTFLKISGACAVGLSALPFVKAVAQEKKGPAYVNLPEAITGKRWAMVVDVPKCQEYQRRHGECTRCSEACHTVHNVPTIEGEEEIKWIWQDTFEHAFPGTAHEYVPEELREGPFILLCNHCANPPCVQVCPTKATFQREDGIVMMDHHRCIGCRYCMAGCPFGARSFNWRDPRPYIKQLNYDFPTRRRGVVEKCTFCPERLAVGLQPACVEACPAKALIFGDLEDPVSEVRRILKEKFTLRRKFELGTYPNVYYIV